MVNQKILLAKFAANWSYVFLAALLTCAGNLCLKQARLQGGTIYSPFFVSALFCYGINVLVFSQALDRLPVSLAYPVFAGLGFIFIAVFSRFFFQEIFGLYQWIGMALILVGLGCMSLSSR